MPIQVPPLNQMDEQSIAAYMRGIGKWLGEMLPQQLFCLVVFGTKEEQGVGQYIANCNRADVIKALREFADALETRQDNPRVEFPPAPDAPSI